jgi:hypothetical protein
VSHSPAWDRRRDRHWPLRNRWLVVKVRWSDSTWRERLTDVWYLVRG